MHRNKIIRSLLLWGSFLSWISGSPLLAQEDLVLISPEDDILTGTILIQATNTIWASNQIAPGAEATYRAGIFITLSDGFRATEGSNFLARIGILTQDIRVPVGELPSETSKV